MDAAINDFLQRLFGLYNFGPSLEKLQKTFALYLDKDIDMLKLGFILPNLPSVCLHNFEAVKNELNQRTFAPVKQNGGCRTIEAMQKLIAFYHGKDYVMLKLICTIPNLETFV